MEDFDALSELNPLSKQAMVRVFQMDPDPAAPLCILSDSRYSIDCKVRMARVCGTDDPPLA